MRFRVGVCGDHVHAGQRVRRRELRKLLIRLDEACEAAGLKFTGSCV